MSRTSCTSYTSCAALLQYPAALLICKNPITPLAALAPSPKSENGEAASSVASTSSLAQEPPTATIPQEPEYRPFTFNLLEALAATGLRSIRYAREIPLLKRVTANDLSASAVKAMKRNLALNFPAERPIEDWLPEKAKDSEGGVRAPPDTDLDDDALMNGKDGIAQEVESEIKRQSKSKSSEAAEAPQPAGSSSDPLTSETSAAEASAAEAAIHPQCKVKINEGDAMDVMYSHRKPGSRFDVVDLDPYGTAVPFIDGAVQSVSDGGLLCVTCTDLAVLASNNYPEKAFALYGGSCTRSEFSHEIALRLVLHSISAAAAKYGRYIQPMLSLSIDFYVRLFIRVHTAPVEVKKLASKTGIAYICSYCGNTHEQRLGRATEQEGKGKKAQPFTKFQNGAGPTTPGEGSKCEECGSQYLVSRKGDGRARHTAAKGY